MPSLRHLIVVLFASAVMICSGCEAASSRPGPLTETNIRDSSEIQPTTRIESEDVRKVLESAFEQTAVTTNYTQDYFSIPYPNGDVPIETGACTDVVIRAFRKAGVDLQKEVHEDMRANFGEYPKKWGLQKTDTNIDHRRVPNLQTYFKRRGTSLPVSSSPENYRPGDVVSWDLDGKGMTHIGIVSNRRSESSGRYLIIHNIGGGTKLEDRLFDWKITGHYRYF
jgi:uncharacterized protein